jgi:hypothetical protein
VEEHIAVIVMLPAMDGNADIELLFAVSELLSETFPSDLRCNEPFGSVQGTLGDRPKVVEPQAEVGKSVLLGLVEDVGMGLKFFDEIVCKELLTESVEQFSVTALGDPRAPDADKFTTGPSDSSSTGQVCLGKATDP